MPFKGQLEQQIDAQFCQSIGTSAGAHQAKGRRVRREVLARVRGKGQHGQRRINRAACQVDHSLVAQMYAVKITDGGAGALGLGRDGLVVTENTHCRGVARPMRGCKMRYGAGWCGLVELARRGKHGGLADQDLFPVNQAAAIQNNAPLGVVD